MSDALMYGIALSAVVLLLILLFWLFMRRRRSLHWQINRQLSEYSLEHVENLVIPDGVGGWLEIRHLFRTPQGFLIIETCDIDGHIYAAEHMQQWRCIQAGRSHPFPNPLEHCRHAMHAIHQVTAEVPVFYHVVFPSKANFPKGQPTQVSRVSDTRKTLQLLLTAPTRQIDYAGDWQQLIKSAEEAH